jgi:exodeoxyribonuclease V beta subunit
MSVTEAVTHPVMAQDILSGFHLIEADAGTGKTWTLASLVVRAIREGRCTLGEILVVTFTKAATSELAERIRLFLESALDETVVSHKELASLDAGELAEEKEPRSSEQKREVERLRLALAQIDTLKVQTIHGFCQAVLAENSFALDLPATFKIREGDDSDLEQVLAQWWRDKVLADGLRLESRLWKALFLSGLSLKTIRGILKHQLSDPDLWVLPSASELKVKFTGKESEDEDAVVRFLNARLRDQDEAFAAMQNALRQEGIDLLAWLCGPAKKLARPGIALGRRYQDKSGRGWIQKLLSCTQVEDLYTKEAQKLLGRFSYSIVADLVDLQDCPFNAVLQVCDKLLKLLPSLSAMNALLAQALNARMLTQLHEFRKAKGELGYDGLLQEVYLLVSQSPQACKLLRERFPLAMIDESQDTDPLQWKIFEKVYLPSDQGPSGSGSLIMVGDPKQSIYAFRGANVFTFLRAGDRVIRKHHLSVNRRSSPVILEAINAIFSEQRLAKHSFNQSEILFTPALDDPQVDWSARSSTFELISFETAAATMPEKKRSAVQACVDKIFTLKAEPQAKSEADELAVLVFSHGQAALIEAALEERGIASARISKENVWQGRWAHELLIILQALTKTGSLEDLNRALLTEPFLAVESVDALQLNVLEAGNVWHRIGPQAALASLVLHAGLSLQAYTGYQQLIELVGREFSAISSPAEVADWLEAKSRDNSKQDASAPWRLDDPSAVKIMTIHNSKGLEFDTVLLPFAWSKTKGSNKSIETQRHHRFEDGAWHSVVDSLKSEQSRRRIEEESLSESLRLFYVAITRAKRQLFLFSPKSPDKDSPLDYLCAQSIPARISRLGAMSSHQNQGLGSAPEELAVQAREPWPLDAPTHDFAPRWGWHSYTALTRRTQWSTQSSEDVSQAQSPIPAADYEQDTEIKSLQLSTIDADVEASDVELGRLVQAQSAMRFRFPKGAKAGVVLHGLLEKHPFTHSACEASLSAQLLGSGLTEVLSSVDEINAWLDEILATPLAALGGAGLNSLEPVRRKMELSFTLEISKMNWPLALASINRHFPVSESAQSLARPDLFAEPHGRNDLSRLNGFLNGFIDMVFEYQGQYFILDWKSNFLGDKLSDYRLANLKVAISEHDYAVQWCLYGVALLRWLRLKFLGEDPLPRMGGVVYAFIRGMRGAGKAQAQRLDSGIFSTEIPPSLLVELDAILGGTSLSRPLFGND